MTIQTYLIIDTTINIVVNVVMWDGSSSWTPPANSLTLVKETTPAMLWALNAEGDWDLKQTLGAGAIDFTWDGFAVTTNEEKPKPISPIQPITTGTKTA